MAGRQRSQAETTPASPSNREGTAAPAAEGRQGPAGAAARALRRVKAAHTLIWALFAGSTLAIPVFAWLGRIGHAALFAGIVLLEVVILMLNGWRCPLTDVAARYTDDRRDNFDIYLPLWLARYNKQVFGTLYVAGVLLTLLRWAAWPG